MSVPAHSLADMSTARTLVERDGDDLVVSDRPTDGRGGEDLTVVPHQENLAEHMSEQTRGKLASWVVDRLDEDRQSRREWESEIERSFTLLGLGAEAHPDSADDENADTSTHPLLLTTLIRFQSNAITEMITPRGVATAQPLVNLTQVPTEHRLEAEKELERTCDRVRDFYNDYFLKQLKTWQEDHDRAVLDTGITGVAFKKVFTDASHPTLPVQVEQVDAENLVVNYKTNSLTEGRVTHIVPNMATSKLKARMAAGVYRQVEIKTDGVSLDVDNNVVTKARDTIQGLDSTRDSDYEGHTVYEMHCELEIPEDGHPQGLARPYVLTVHATTQELLAVRRNWREGDPAEGWIQAFVCYLFHPGKSPVYGWGLGTILANITEAVRTAQREGLTAAYLANHPGGFKKAGLGIRNTSSKVRSGEFIDVDAPETGAISDSLMAFPFRGVDPGLVSLMQQMLADGQELGGTAITNIAEMVKNNAPVGTALAVLDESQKFMGAVHMRLFRGLCQELSLLHEHMTEMADEVGMPYNKGTMALQPGDLSMVEIGPFMRPGQPSRHRRILEAQAVMETSATAPDLVNKRNAVRNYFTALGIDDIDHLLNPEPTDAQPADPVTEYGKVIRGEPVTAGPAQNHNAHLEAHAAGLELLKQSQLPIEVGQQAITAMSAHIGEHLALDLAVQVASATGVPLDAFQQGIPPEIEQQIAPQIAEIMKSLVQEEEKGLDPEQVKLSIAAIQADSRRSVEEIRERVAIMKTAHENYQIKLREMMQTGRNDADNDTLILLQRMKAGADYILQEREIAAEKAIALHRDSTQKAIASKRTDPPPRKAGTRSGASSDAKTGTGSGTGTST